MHTTITLMARIAYGVVRVYPACDVSRNLARLTCSKTFTPYDLDAIRALGYVIGWTAAPGVNIPDAYLAPALRKQEQQS